MNNGPQFIFLARPLEAASVTDLFAQSSKARQILEHPGELRQAGWNLETRQQANIVKGEYLEVKIPGYKRLQLYENGTLAVRVAGDEGFVGWGKSARDFAQRPRINSLALVEVVYSFADLYRQVVAITTPRGKSHVFRILIQNASVGDQRIYLNPYGIQTWAWMLDDHRYPAPADSFDRELTATDEIVMTNSARVAYLIVERIYFWFGVPVEEIPYMVELNGARQVDVEKVRRGGKD